jgi:hypothetical protein
MINEKECVTNRFISVPADHGSCFLYCGFPLFQDAHTDAKGSLNCAAYIAGIIEGALSAADFPSTVFHLHVSSNTVGAAQRFCR